MHTWFQNLNKDWKWPLHFRGTIGKDHRRDLIRYEFSSRKNLRFTFTIGPAKKINLSIGAIFFTLYLTLPFFGFKRMREAREFGFYFYEWAFVAYWNKDPMTGSSQIYFHIDEFFLGKTKRVCDSEHTFENIYFKLGGKEFVLNNVKIEAFSSFRTYIPFALYHHKYNRVDIKCDNPPQYSGKGENSWDCGDNGSYGLGMPWKHALPSWQESSREETAKLACDEYVTHVLEQAGRYGSSKSEKGISSKDVYEYIGFKKDKVVEKMNGDSCAQGV